MIKTFDFLLNIKAEFDTETQEINVVSCEPIITHRKIDKHHVISATEARFGILTLGANFKKTHGLPLNHPISLVFEGKTYENIKTHKSVSGRIDGLTRFYNESKLDEGIELLVDYDAKLSILKLTRKQ